MAQSGEKPINPMPALLPVPQSGSSGTAKRRREDADGQAEASSSKRQNLTQDVIFRIVVPSRQIGKVIGKVGSRIQKIREDTRATIKIADAVALELAFKCSVSILILYNMQRHEERVIIISSKENEGAVTYAENALQKIAALILKEDDVSGSSGNGVEASNAGVAAGAGTGHVGANTIRLLIAGSQAGSLIGISGQNIEKLRESSGANIAILAPTQLPLCASAYESDRVVQLWGDVPAVLKALEEIGCQLRVNPPRQVISISPTYNHSTIRPPQPYVDTTSADYITLEMMVSETLIGGLIGRYGSNISRIRNESGAVIKVYGGKGQTKQRQIQLGGSAQQVALAKHRVDEYIYSQLVQQTGPQQSLLQG